MDANLPLQSHGFVMTLLPWLIPTFLLGHLVAFLNRLLVTYLGRFPSALGLRDIGTNLTRNRDAALLGHLLASLIGYVLALGVCYHGADLTRSCFAFGVGRLLAVLHRQILTLFPRHLLAHLVAGALLEWNTPAYSFSQVDRCFLDVRGL